MIAIIQEIALAALVASTWLAALGFTRLRAPLDRLHCVAFVVVTAGGALVVAALTQDGVSDRVGKILFALAISLFGGAAGSHAIGRALLARGSAPE